MIEARLSLQRPGFALDVALDLPAQGASALFGPSGCGKTTVLRALAGLEPVRGRVVVEGEVWQDDAQGIFVPPHRRAVGYVIQESALFPHLSVAGNLDYGRRRSGGDAARLATLVQLLDIGPLMGRRPDTLSGGERQRVAIARALATGPRLLLMDEPMAALDAARKAELLPYLQRLQAESRVPLVYVSHAFDEVAQLADHLVLMAAGCVQAAGPLTELTARLDLPLAQSDAAGVVLEATLAGRDETWHLARLDVGPGDFELWARDPGCPAGRRLRARLLARDLSLARAPQAGSSIGNQVAGVVDGIGDDAHPALALVRVRIGRAHVLARLTRRSVHALALAPGEAVWVQVKTVALLE